MQHAVPQRGDVVRQKYQTRCLNPAVFAAPVSASCTGTSLPSASSRRKLWTPGSAIPTVASATSVRGQPSVLKTTIGIPSPRVSIFAVICSRSWSIHWLARRREKA